MSKKRKLLLKILGGSKNIRFDEFVALVEAFGFVLRRIAGSHHIYKHPRSPEILSLQPTKDGQAKSYQIRQFLDLTEQYNLVMEDDEENEE